MFSENRAVKTALWNAIYNNVIIAVSGGIPKLPDVQNRHILWG
jgi:hypothetical protein